MFKALHKSTGEEIVILEPRWRRQLGLLRLLDTQDDILCQGCYQPVRVRAGEIKRWHFAHKHLQNCPYESESPILLKTRAVLYEWLVSQRGEGRVVLEKKIALPRPVDCWVDYDAGGTGYWIIDTRMPPDERSSLAAGMLDICSNPVWIFTASMLHTDPDSLDRLYLTTTERAFMQHTRYDDAVQSDYASPGASLHYLDAEREILTSIRGLRVYHGPQLYSGHWHESHLSDVKIYPETGEFVHPGEDEMLGRYHKAILSRERQQQEAERRITLKMAELFGETGVIQASSQEPGGNIARQPVGNGEAELPTCIFCGKKTDDYWYLNRADNTCKCRDCYRQGNY